MHLEIGARSSLSHFAFGALPGQLFGRLPQLTHVWLNNTGVTSLPANLGLCTDLEQLEVLVTTGAPAAQLALALPAEAPCLGALRELALTVRDVSPWLWRLRGLISLTLDQLALALHRRTCSVSAG